MPEPEPRRRWRELADENVTDPHVWSIALGAELGLLSAQWHDKLADWFRAAQHTAVAEALAGVRSLGQFAGVGPEVIADVMASALSTPTFVIEPRGRDGVCMLCQATAGVAHSMSCPTIAGSPLVTELHEAYAAHQWDRGDD